MKLYCRKIGKPSKLITCMKLKLILWANNSKVWWKDFLPEKCRWNDTKACCVHTFTAVITATLPTWPWQKHSINIAYFNNNKNSFPAKAHIIIPAHSSLWGDEQGKHVWGFALQCTTSNRANILSQVELQLNFWNHQISTQEKGMLYHNTLTFMNLKICWHSFSIPFKMDWIF